MLIEGWLDIWKGLIDVEPKTEGKYKYLEDYLKVLSLITVPVSCAIIIK
jgi:hypothetical protein